MQFNFPDNNTDNRDAQRPLAAGGPLSCIHSRGTSWIMNPSLLLNLFFQDIIIPSLIHFFSGPSFSKHGWL